MRYIVSYIEEDGIASQLLYRIPLSDSVEKYVVKEDIKALELENKVSRMILQMGIPASTKGRDYIRDAVLKVMENKGKMSITKELYPYIAKKNNDTATRVERAIRHAVGAALDRCDPDLIGKVFGNVAFGGSLTNTQFIYHLAEYVQYNL